MKPFFLTLFIAALVVFSPAMTRADEASHRQAVESLLGLMQMETVLSQSIDQMLQMQIKQNPALAPYEQDMKSFLAKYMSWSSVKGDIVGLYMAEFTEPELKELTAFYQTPLGKKTVQKMPVLMAKGAEIGQQRVQAHLPELQAAITEKEQAKAGSKKAP